MARIRTIKPEFWQDEKLAQECATTRLVFLGLISQADDAGRLVDNVKLLDGLLFPHTDDTCGPSLDLLAGIGRIVRYRSSSGQALLQLANWNKHQNVQKPGKIVLPGPSSRESPESLQSTAGESPPRNASAQAPDLGPRTEDLGPRTEDQTRVIRLHAGDPLENSISQIIIAANRGMIDNPLIGDTCRPITISHGSRQFVHDWLSDGIPPEVCAAIVYQRAKGWIPNERRRQITTMAYFDGAVRDEGDKHRARNASLPTDAPAAGPKADNSEVGKFRRANPDEYLALETATLEEFNRYEWFKDAGKSYQDEQVRQAIKQEVRKRLNGTAAIA